MPSRKANHLNLHELPQKLGKPQVRAHAKLPQPCRPLHVRQEDRLCLAQQFLGDLQDLHKVRVRLQLHQNHELDLGQIPVFRNPKLVRARHNVLRGAKTQDLILFLGWPLELNLEHQQQ